MAGECPQTGDFRSITEVYIDPFRESLNSVTFLTILVLDSISDKTDQINIENSLLSII